MHVVEDENERPVRGEALEQQAHRSMALVALVRHGASRVDAVDQRQHLHEIPQHIQAERLEKRGRESPHISSIASATTQNGTSRSSSEAVPLNARWPRASALPISSSSKRVFPMPGSPRSATAPPCRLELLE